MRTLRIPDDGKVYPLPPGLGTFPVRPVAEYAERVPARWREWGGVFIPMYQREALWLRFSGAYWKPNAVKVGIGRIDALSGEAWDEELRQEPQDYVVCPGQPWLDGINAGDGVIRQFVAAPLGQGDTVEEQLTGQAEFGGLQFVVFEPKPGRFPDQEPTGAYPKYRGVVPPAPAAAPAEMGLGAGGRMKQEIYRDTYGIETWDPENRAMLFVHIVNSEQYEAVTGEPPPPCPISARTYSEYGFPWFDLYDETRQELPASRRLAGVKSLSERARTGEGPDAEDQPVTISDWQLQDIINPPPTDTP
jgi:hypothetical protein